MKKKLLSVMCGLIIAISTISISVSAGSAELYDGESQKINVYLTTTLDDESSNPNEPLNPDGTSQTNDSQNNPSEQNQNDQSSKSNPITGDVDFVLPGLILMVSASTVLLAYFIRKQRS